MLRRSSRPVAASLATFTLVGASLVVLVPFAATAASAAYCSKIATIMSSSGAISPAAGNPKAFKAMASALRASNPPAEVKQAVSDFASGLDDLASKIGSIKNKDDVKNLAKDFGAGSKYQRGLLGIVKYERSCATGGVATTVKAAAAAKGPIPVSAAIDTMAKNIPGNKAAFPVVQNCSLLSALAGQQALGVADDATVKGRLTKLVDAVRPIDGAVADALAKVNAKDAATWCKQRGFAN